MKNCFVLKGDIIAKADQRLNNPTVKKLWDSFCLKESQLQFEGGEEFTFRIGRTPLPNLPDGKEYSLVVDNNGVAIKGDSYSGLVRGLASLLMKIECFEDGLVINFATEESQYKLKNRMLHICVFPENDLYFIKKLVRFAAMCQYTHIVIEFWGMLKFDCLKELAWPNAFSKEQAAQIIAECRDLGIEPIPMFNHLGHASGSRVRNGKHVVLDQNPLLQRFFTPDGWAWNINSAKTAELLTNVRKELYDLFGEGEYIHIGCDEAYYITKNDNLRMQLPEYLGTLTQQVEAEGRRPMIWMDMLLEEGRFAKCYTVGKAGEAEKLRNATADSTIFVDWQYDCDTTPISSLLSLKDCGRDCMGAPWYRENNYVAHINTVAENDMFGIMMTTWHTLKDHMQSIIFCAQKLGAKTFSFSPYSSPFEETASLLRRVSFEGNTYADSGWSKEQMDV